MNSSIVYSKPSKFLLGKFSGFATPSNVGVLHELEIPINLEGFLKIKMLPFIEKKNFSSGGAFRFNILRNNILFSQAFLFTNDGQNRVDNSSFFNDGLFIIETSTYITKIQIELLDGLSPEANYRYCFEFYNIP